MAMTWTLINFLQFEITKNLLINFTLDKLMILIMSKWPSFCSICISKCEMSVSEYGSVWCILNFASEYQNDRFVFGICLHTMYAQSGTHYRFIQCDASLVICSAIQAHHSKHTLFVLCFNLKRNNAHLNTHTHSIARSARVLCVSI